MPFQKDGVEYSVQVDGVPYEEVQVDGETFWTALRLLEDHNSGLGAYDATNSWFTGTTHAVEGDAARNNSGSQDDLIANAGSLPADFEPGNVWFSEVYVANQSADLLFGSQDVSPSNQYELRLYSGGGVEMFVDNGGSNTSLGLISGVDVNGGLDDRPLMLAIEWDPKQYGGYDENDSDGSHYGDFLVTVATPDWEPIVQMFVDANDTTYRSGGLGFRSQGGADVIVDRHWMGSRNSYEDYETIVQARDYLSKEIDHFETWRMDKWAGNTDEVAIVDPTKHGMPATPDGYINCLMNPEGTGYTKLDSNTIPSGIGPGEIGEMWVGANSLSGGKVMWGFDDGPDLHRVECRFDSNDVRYYNSKTGDFNDYSVSWNTGEWYRTVADRTSSDSVTWTVEDDSGNTLWSEQRSLVDSFPETIHFWLASNGGGDADLFCSGLKRL